MTRSAMTLCIYACVTCMATPLQAANQLGGIPLAVVSVHDQLSDTVTDELRGALATALSRQEGIHVVAQDLVAEVMAYHESPKLNAQVHSSLSHALNQMERAKQHYLDFGSDEAQAEIKAALSAIQLSPLPLADKGELLSNALITAAFIFDGQASLPFLHQIFQLDPGYSCDAPQFPPKLRKLCEKTRQGALSVPSGSLLIESEPKVAEVTVNGIPKGVTPVQLESLPAGDYMVRVSGNRYHDVSQLVTVVANETVPLRVQLKWKKGADSPASTSVSASDARELIREGVRLIELLRLQKVVLLDVDDEASGGTIRARMIDSTTKASHRPVIVQFQSDKSNLAQDMSEMVRLLAAQALMKRIDNPVAQLDPAGVGEPIVLGRRKSRRVSPLGWGIIGGVAGGGAIAGILVAVLSGGGGSSGSGTGSVNVVLGK